ncbi:MAG: hypothetical protein BM556_08125 [Bacteriovorax sp. MedPE-SWde]|nr:MAG: hypothetical protein BM556_08125 [Bacteriovorax sp. MedPE-SWde]
MINVQTFIKNNDEFIEISKVVSDSIHEEYIDGAIYLTINHQNIMSFELWDTIDDLWGYICNGLEEVSNGKEFECFFPDQPVKIKFFPVGFDRVLVQVGDKKGVSIDKIEFLSEMKKGAIFFFENLKRISPTNKELANDIISQVDSL